MGNKKLLGQVKRFEKTYSQTKLERAQALHQQFLVEFPRSKLKEMSIDEYALGKTKTGSFCWWLEYNTLPLGSIKGGNASKLVIYYSIKDGEWKYPKQFKSVYEAWDKLRSDILTLLESYAEPPYRGLDDDSLLFTTSMLRGKILYLYYPDKLLPIYSLSNLQQILRKLEVPEEEWRDLDNIECNLLLKEKLRDISPLKDWATIKTMNFFYATLLRQPKFYKIAPGIEAKYWEECLEGGYISMGWNEVGDLRHYPDYEEYRNAFEQCNYYTSASKTTEKANELWCFYNLQPGDKIVVNKGKSRLLGVGTVKDERYDFRDDLDTQQHIVHVNWEKTFVPPRDISRQEYWGVKAILELSEKEFTGLLTLEDDRTLDQQGIFPNREEKFFERLEKALERKSQCILYGPPGTGKTYLARRFIKWKNSKLNLEQTAAEEIGKLWMMIASAKQHFQWESILGSGGTVDYSLRNIRSNFIMAKKGEKVLCYRGGATNRAFVGIAEIESPFDGKYLQVRGIRSFTQPIDFDEVKDAPEYKTSQPGRMGNRGTMFEVNRELGQWFVNYLYEVGDEESAKLLSEATSKINYEICTFHPSYNYEDFIEGYKPVREGDGSVSFQLEKGFFSRLCDLARENVERPHFLIIDEINRGNIPKIFGEIITLLEKDKRGLEVVLPQSKETFSVPSNLFIIGTMNTADRSIKMMDAALKRRFTFIECMPDLNLLKKDIDDLGLSPAVILEAINRKLVAFGGRDKQIGHSYFMNDGVQINTVAELKDIFELEIIPLVQEYCFDDYEQLAAIVGEGFIDREQMTVNTVVFQETDDIFISIINRQFKGAIDEETV